jgi:LEA14-like dessication related protein
MLRHMKKQRIVIILGLIVVILLGFFVLQYLADATAMNNFKITIKQVNVTHIGITSCYVIVTVNFTNPTSYDLPISSATMDVYIADSYVGHSDVSAFTIPKRSITEQQISLTVLYANLAHAVLQGLLNNSFQVNVIGSAQGYIFYGLFKTTVPFRLSSTHS